MPSRRSLNYKILLFLAPLLLLTGIVGFLLPGQFSVSTEPAYNVFHIVFGVIGLLLVIFRYENPVRVFNISFGLIDIYQAIASFYDIFPAQYLKWTPTDDALHLVIGIFLLFAGLGGFFPLRRLNAH